MIRTIAHCPYCSEGVVAIDDVGFKIALNPDGVTDAPCGHLCHFWVGIVGDDWSRHSFWERGRGLRKFKLGSSDDFIQELTLGLLVEEYLPHVAYQVVGATAGEREEKAPGTGDFLIRPVEGFPQRVLFDAYAVYAPDADTFLAAVREQLRTWI